ncbi:glycosyltransferase [Oryzifoliimicrobium ureilyticus]|uniref:glycosyltransferase n=1 Tax=Oryzifoliimicrobium ureilyticus TaxID=3113724 RepID=UPI0030766974
MKVFLVASPLAGHLSPLLSIARILVAEGHDILCLSGSDFKDLVERAGAAFREFGAAADVNQMQSTEVTDELKRTPPGVQRLRVAIQRRFIELAPAQHAKILEALKDFSADLIIGDSMMFGLLPIILRSKSTRPPVILCGTSILHSQREDGSPPFIGLPPAQDHVERKRYADIAQKFNVQFEHPIAQRLRELGIGPLQTSLFNAMVELPDAFLQLTVPGFEFPMKLPRSVHFVGALPIIPDQAPLPPWSSDLDGSRKVVLVTQGTVANNDLNLLVAPTLAALANRPDVLVVVTTGGRPLEAIPGPHYENVRAATYLPFEWLLPKVDVLVTNGGYGTVNQALSFGIPLVTAGLTEDKADVNARVTWSGAGIDLKTNAPEATDIREAVLTVLGEPEYRAHASSLAKEFSSFDSRSAILDIVKDLTHGPSTERKTY